jgi:hypothetical protein
VLSKELARFTGAQEARFQDVVKRLWAYARSKNLQARGSCERSSSSARLTLLCVRSVTTAASHATRR